MSELYQRFLDSLKIDYYKWHEGIGYDLDALSQLDSAEKAQVEKLLLAKNCDDWRDVEALDVIGTPAAIEALKIALISKRFEVRVMAAEKLAKSGHLTPAEVEQILLDTIPQVTILNGMTFTFHLAELYPTLPVRRALLKCALDGKPDARMHAAALAEYLYGVSKSYFDFDYQDFYRRFIERDRQIRRAAYLELCQRVHDAPLDE